MTKIEDVLEWKYLKPGVMPLDLNKGYVWISKDTYESIDWNCSIEKPTKEQIAQDIIDYESYKKSIKYLSDRLPLYGSFGDQLDMQYHDLMNGTTTWKDHITSVKQQCPKPV